MAIKRSSARRKKYPEPRLSDTVRLSATGLSKILGDLEARVMRAIWELGEPVPARAVHERVAAEHPVALLTVITVLNKLVGKGLLHRAKRNDLLHYEACQTQDEFMAYALRHVVEGVLLFGTECVATSLVDVLAERNPAELARLAEIVSQRVKREESAS